MKDTAETDFLFDHPLINIQEEEGSGVLDELPHQFSVSNSFLTPTVNNEGISKERTEIAEIRAELAQYKKNMKRKINGNKRKVTIQTNKTNSQEE